MESEQRRAVSRPQGTQDWDDQKTAILELRSCNHLDEVMKRMEEEHLFKATKNQYKKQFKKWESDLVPKRITGEVYGAITSKKRKRERAGKTSSAFRWQGAEVKDSNITRFQKRKKILDADELPEISTPSDLSCFTPASIASSRSQSRAASDPLPSPTSELTTLVNLTGLCSFLSHMEQSPQFFPFEWYPAFEDFIHRYAAGTPTIQSEQIRGLPGCFDYPRYGSEPWLEFSLTIEALKPTCPALDNKHYLKSALLELKRGVKQYLKQFPKQAQDLLPLIIDNLEKVFSALFGPLLGLSYSIWPIYIGAWGNSAETVLEYVDFLSEEDSNQVYDKLCLAAEYAVLGYRNPAVNIIEQLLNPRSKTSVAQSLGLEHCYDRISRQPATPENPGAYDPCLTEAARWEELEG